MCAIGLRPSWKIIELWSLHVCVYGKYTPYIFWDIWRILYILEYMENIFLNIWKIYSKKYNIREYGMYILMYGNYIIRIYGK